MSTVGMSSPAAWVLRSLLEHPERRTIEDIVTGPIASEGADAREVTDGLSELQQRGLAVEEPGAGWRATDAAHATA